MAIGFLEMKLDTYEKNAHLQLGHTSVKTTLAVVVLSIGTHHQAFSSMI